MRDFAVVAEFRLRSIEATMRKENPDGHTEEVLVD